MFTDIKWSNNNKTVKNKSNSFVFKFDENEFTVFKHKGKNYDEVWHRDYLIFAMYGGPWAVQVNQKSMAHLGNNFIAP